ncbi:hypothetical protein [Methanooceanicella nereidis]|nr:hypothetical protein [Methanocella sp. CWC-04]
MSDTYGIEVTGCPLKKMPSINVSGMVSTYWTFNSLSEKIK